MDDATGRAQDRATDVTTDLSEGPATDLATPSSFLILHGYENRRPPGHWQRWLSLELTARGHDVRYPQLPDPDHPDLGRWRQAALTNLATLTEGTVTVIAHSASAVLWLHEQSRGSAPRVDRVALVSPPAPDVMEGIEAVRAFAWRPAEGDPQDPAGRLPLGAREAILIAGDDDAFLPDGVAATWSGLGARQIELAGAGHITPSSGFGAWPEMLAWCLGERAFGASAQA
jgi:hypothetical protein